MDFDELADEGKRPESHQPVTLIPVHGRGFSC